MTQRVRACSCRVLLPWAASFLLVVGEAALAQVPPQYANALSRAEYQVFSGDVNGDGHVDVLAKAKVVVVPIDLGDLFVPIVVRPPSATFAIISQSGGVYSVITPVSASILSSSVWQAGTHDVLFGDTSGDGNPEMVVRSRSAGGASFTVATSSSGSPTLLQHLSVTTLGVDLGASGSSLTLNDTNRDGRSDIVVRVNGRVSNVLLADANGTYEKPPDSNGFIISSWYAFCASLNAEDIDSALGFISLEANGKYSAALGALGPSIASLSQGWSDIRAVRISTDFAVFLVTQNFGGSERGHLVSFVREDSRWVLHDF